MPDCKDKISKEILTEMMKEQKEKYFVERERDLIEDIKNSRDMPTRGKLPSYLDSPRRNNYFYGKLMDEFHFRMEQNYFNRKRWLLNHLGFGEGILYGLNVYAKGNKVIIEPGVAIDAYGREIIVPELFDVDPWQLTDDCGQPTKILCKEGTNTVYLYLGYRECTADFMPAFVSECNTQERCEAGTIVECYNLLVKNEAPEQWGSDICKIFKGDNIFERRVNLFKYLTDESENISARSKNPRIFLGTVNLSVNEITNVDPCPEWPERSILCSNEKLLDMIMCLSEQGGSGAQGLKGEPGSRWFNGKGEPSDAVGAVGAVKGDYYLDTDTGNVYELVDSNWNLVGNIKGKDGPEGLPGKVLDEELTHIVGTSWNHDGVLSFGDFFSKGLTVTFDKEVYIAGNLEKKCIQDLRGWFVVTLEDTDLNVNDMVYGVIKTNEDKLPTKTITFIPQRTKTPLSSYAAKYIDLFCRIVVKCDFILDKDNKCVDGNNLRGKFVDGTGKSGNGIPGGNFESWVFLKIEEE